MQAYAVWLFKDPDKQGGRKGGGGGGKVPGPFLIFEKWREVRFQQMQYQGLQ